METAQSTTEQPTPVTIPESTTVPSPVAVPPPKPSREDFYSKQGLTEETKIPAQESASPTPPSTEAKTATSSPEPPPAPKLYAKKFTSPEELEKAYVELQSFQTKKNQEINQALKEVKAAEKEDKNIAEVIAAPADTDGPDPLLDPKGYKEYVIREALQRQAQERRAEEIRTEWRNSNNDILDLEPLVSFKLLSDPRIKEATNLDALNVLINEHTAYARGLATKYREAGRQEIQQKLNSIPPSAPQNSIDGPPSQETTTSKDPVAEMIAMRNASRIGRIRVR